MWSNGRGKIPLAEAKMNATSNPGYLPKETTVEVCGEMFHWTGKVGTNRRTNLPAAEFQSAQNPGKRVWILQNGEIVEE
jgi:hypothetical protein